MGDRERMGLGQLWTSLCLCWSRGDTTTTSGEAQLAMTAPATTNLSLFMGQTHWGGVCSSTTPTSTLRPTCRSTPPLVNPMMAVLAKGSADSINLGQTQPSLDLQVV